MDMKKEELKTSIRNALEEGSVEEALKLLLRHTQTYNRRKIEDIISRAFS